jgi:hypothetical protein
MTCSQCKRKAVYRVANGFQGNGKVVCASNVCWGAATGGYPAEGKPLTPSAR